MQHFILDDRTVTARRISQETIQRYAGHSIAFLSPDRLPHWNKVALAKERLTEGERIDRHSALVKMLGAGQSWHSRTPFARANTPNMVTERFATIFPYKRGTIFTRHRPERFFDAVLRYGPDADEALTTTFFSFLPRRNAQRFVFPTLHAGETDFWNMQALRASIMLLDNTEDARTFWAKILDMPIERLVNYPRDDMHLLLTEAHDMRHLRQIWAESQLDRLSYHCEVDAEFFARRALRQKNIGAETLTASQHRRYYRMLATAPSYWIAPAVDNLEAGLSPPEFIDIYKAVREIHVRLGMAFAEKPHRHLASSDLQHALSSRLVSGTQVYRDPALLQTVEEAGAFYDSNCKNLLRTRPEVVLSALRGLIENGSFQKNGLSHILATRIVAGATYFNPELTQEPPLLPDLIPCRSQHPSPGPVFAVARLH